jgi:ribokinase
MASGIVVVGSLNMDFAVRVERLPAPGETVHGWDFQMSPGGKGANQACACGLLGAGAVVETKMIGRVGYDLFADHLKASLSCAGVDVSAVHATRSQPTGVALIWIDRNGQNSIVVSAGANHAISAKDVEAFRSVFTGARWALFQLETPLEVVAAGLSLAREMGLHTMLDPAPARELPRDLLEKVNILTPNDTEAAILLGRGNRAENVRETARQLLAMGPKSVVLKLGERGCFYADGQGELAAPAFPVNPLDTTAAGDVFNGGLAVALTEEKPMEQALELANAAAALSVTRRGAQSAVPKRTEVDEMLRSKKAGS